MPRPVNYSHESATSKISFTSRRCDGPDDCYQGVFAIGYPNLIPVPDNPEIVKSNSCDGILFSVYRMGYLWS
ncbi:MAG: hypothetical protein IPN39_05200 [Chitinophagaceae bacterium]|nr:hypothetical protein [Chitinophagaceae bacterium]